MEEANALCGRLAGVIYECGPSAYEHVRGAKDDEVIVRSTRAGGAARG